MRHLARAARAVVRARWPTRAASAGSRRNCAALANADALRVDAGRRVEEGARDCRRSTPDVSGWRSRWPRGANVARSNAIARAAGSSTTCPCAKSCCGCRARPRRWPALPEMQESVVRKCGEELLALVRDAGISDPPPPLPRRERPDPALLAHREAPCRHRGRRGRGALTSAPKCWPRVASSNDWPRAAATSACCAAGGRTWSGRSCCQRFDLRRARAGAHVRADLRLTPCVSPCAVTLSFWRRATFRRRLLGRLALPARRAALRARGSRPWRAAAARRFLRRFRRCRARPRAAAGLERVEQAPRDLVDRAFGVHGAHQPGVRVVMRHRLARVFLVLAQAFLERCLPGRRDAAPGCARRDPARSRRSAARS